VFTLVLLKAWVTSERCSVFRFAVAPAVVFEDAELEDVLDDAPAVLLFCCAVPLCWVVDPCCVAEPDCCVVVPDPDDVPCCWEEPVVERGWLSLEVCDVALEPVFAFSCDPVADWDEPCCGRFCSSDAWVELCDCVGVPAVAGF